MNPAALINRLIDMEFKFILSEDGSVSFTRPEREDAEADELLGLLAWRWSELEPVALECLAVTKAPAFHPPPGRELRAAG